MSLPLLTPAEHLRLLRAHAWRGVHLHVLIFLFSLFVTIERHADEEHGFVWGLAVGLLMIFVVLAFFRSRSEYAGIERFRKTMESAK